MKNKSLEELFDLNKKEEHPLVMKENKLEKLFKPIEHEIETTTPQIIQVANELKKLLKQIESKNKKEIIILEFFPKLMNLLNFSLKSSLLRDETIYISFEVIITKLSDDEILELLDSMFNMELKERIIEQFTKKLVYQFENNKPLELLNHVTNIFIKQEIIAQYFTKIYKLDITQTFELLNSIPNIALKEEIIVKNFEKLIRKLNNNEILELLESFSSDLKEKILANNFELIAIRFEYKVLELLDSISDKFLKEKALSTVSRLIRKKFKKQKNKLKEDYIFNDNKFKKQKNKSKKDYIVTSNDNKFKKLLKRIELKSKEIQSLNRKTREEARVIFPQLHNKLIQFFDSDFGFFLKDKTIVQNYDKIIYYINEQKSIELLDSIIDKKLKDEVIFNFYGKIIEKFNKNNSLQLLNSISDKKLRYKLVIRFNKQLNKNLDITSIDFMFNFFDIVFQKEKYEPFSVLQQFSKEESDKIIINNAPKLIEIYIQNHKIKNRIFEVVGIVNDKKLKNQLTIDYFDIFFKVNSYKAIRNLNYLDQEEQEKVIIYHFPKLLKNKAFIRLLKRVKNRQKKDEIIAKYFEQILQKDSKLAIKLLQDISNKKLIANTIEKFFPLFLQRYHQYIIDLLNLINNNDLKEKLLIESCKKLAKNRDIKTLLKLLNYIKNDQLKEQIFKEAIETLAQQKEIEAIRKIVNQTQISAVIKEEIKKRCSYLIKEKMNRYIDSLNDIQSTLNSKIKESVILDAYTIIQNQESSKEEIDLQTATPEILSHLIISETNKEKHRELFLYLVERLKEDKSKDYSKIAYKTISRSRIFELYLFELEDFVTTTYFKEEVKNFREQKETEQSINKMLGKVLKNPKTKREEIFMKRFKRLRKIKDLYVVVPHVAKRDFDLAQAIMEKRIDKEKTQQVQRSIFVNEYQTRWNRAVMAYNKIDDFYIKVDLSKIVLNSFVPDFESSFFIQAMMILDSQNIAETPNELAVIAAKEVLKYYGEIEDELENALDEVIEQIVELQRRAKSADEEDDAVWDEIEDEERRIKKMIKADDELYKLFIQRYDMESFRLLSLLKLVIT